MSNSNLPTIKRFYADDYKTAPNYFQQFLSTLNLYSEPIYNILNQGVDLTMNTTEEIYTFTLTNASATGSSNTYNFTPKKFIGQPNGVIIGQCIYNTSNGIATAIGGQVTLDWIYSGNQVKILAIYGLTANKNYTFTLRIF